ncbi:tRNA (guanosine(37)-N1)-methyltransferase TrmD [Candidatus Curtissbacteria bacterium RIFCSPLOWO2_01_FULL_41_18]|uniref:tRNA (guanine-N(1)-)-methyltransferase n=1 Tax=Candidatus Curtissbacteria bacterium RIFCSPLOWO2_01_FULL_41_18 TaxID=1797727 RepID=A0A1F5HKH9_9BACT|nr:MAG: tRNA (guanosine(37)-N1)-methyltransferase TrmD [Candidatus Curtissbacteria bacterium RIFCSPLOWO2_01_FULL_41_18]
MKIAILTLFPLAFENVFSESIIKKAQDKKLLKITLVDIRNFAHDKHQKVDDKPYGGGKGMLLKVDVLVEAIESIKEKPYIILLSPSGKTFNQKKALGLSQKKSLAIICGHYEGIDSRIEEFVDEVISIGDFVLTGGEIAAMIIVDSVARLIPGVIHPESLETESFSPKYAKEKSGGFRLEHPQYTRPENFRGHKVPKILLSGNHQKIDQWQKKESVKKTRKTRPELLKN